MWKNLRKIILALVVLALGVGVAFFVFKTEPRLNKSFETEKAFFKKFPFRLGLDLSGGSHLVYKADVSAVPAGQVNESMDALRDVIERRINIFGISEPVVQIQHGSFVSGGEEQLIVDLPGITDIKEAVKMIGDTPILEFKVEGEGNEPKAVKLDKDGKIDLGSIDLSKNFVATELTGRYLKKASLEFNPNNREPSVKLLFDEKGTELFAKITKENVGKQVAIYLDGAIISSPNVNEEITGGEAVISGGFTPDEAKILVGRLNSGALPVPVTLVSTQTIGAILGNNAINAGVKAAIIGFILVGLFLTLWYRLPGFVATVSLSIFVFIILALFKLLPVTLTAAGIAGFIISMGIAVDANVLVFERIKEEMRAGRTIVDAMKLGFSRAWFSIRDSNISNIITALILFWFGTALIKGFALTLGMGVVVSMFSAIIVTRVFLSVFTLLPEGKVTRFLFGSGISK
ncbi:MAG: protein translocase subunit SecD [Patescibacteria group bacterium]